MRFWNFSNIHRNLKYLLLPRFFFGFHDRCILHRDIQELIERLRNIRVMTSWRSVFISQIINNFLLLLQLQLHVVNLRHSERADISYHKLDWILFVFCSNVIQRILIQRVLQQQSWFYWANLIYNFLIQQIEILWEIYSN